MMFFSWYYSEILCSLGSIPVEFFVAPPGYICVDSDFYDYGMMRLNFVNPDGYTVQQYTGANGWRLDVEGNGILTTVFGYPIGGNMPNCPRDGEHLCAYVGNVDTFETDYAISGVNL